MIRDDEFADDNIAAGRHQKNTSQRRGNGNWLGGRCENAQVLQWCRRPRIVPRVEDIRHPEAVLERLIAYIYLGHGVTYVAWQWMQDDRHQVATVLNRKANLRVLWRDGLHRLVQLHLVKNVVVWWVDQATGRAEELHDAIVVAFYFSTVLLFKKRSQKEITWRWSRRPLVSCLTLSPSMI